MKNKKVKIRKLIGASVVSGLAIAFTMAILLGTNVSNVVVNNPEAEVNTMKWNRINLPLLAESPEADASPEAGASGVLVAYVAKLTADYADNLTDVWGSTNTNDSSAGTDIPYTVNHELAVKVRWNKTHAYNETAGDWDLTFVRAYVNCSACDPEVSAVIADETEINPGETSGDFIYVHYSIDNSDTGYSIDRGDSVDSVAWNFEYYG